MDEGGSSADRSADRWVVERSTIAKHPARPNGDRLFVGAHVAGIVDGSTAKPWETGAVTGVEVAAAVAAALTATGATEDLPTATARATAAVLALPHLAEISPPDRPCATFSLVHLGRREVWRVGDHSIVIDGRAHTPPRAADAAAAKRRASLLRSALRRGVTLEKLLVDDEGRREVLPMLAEANERRNAPDGRAFAAVDGTPIPAAYLEVVPIPPVTDEVVLASDGYPSVRTSLAATEVALHERIRRDPLIIEDPPATKGVAPGAASFDDRSYLRLRVPPKDHHTLDVR